MTVQLNNSKSVLNYARTKLLHDLDPATLFVEEKGLREACSLPHKGLYVSVVSSDGHEVVREGFITSKADNILDSLEKCLCLISSNLKSRNFSIAQFVVAQVILTIVENCSYIADPLMWDVNTDGVYFQWGDRYKGLYLPHQVKQFNLPKTAILDRLVGWETGLAANLWRLECGLVYKLTCTTIR